MRQFLLLAVLFSCWSCTHPTEVVQQEKTLNINTEKFTLDNGLQVVFHLDRSDPVVAVALTAHVGSAREKAGRTGFAHLFEHLLFLESENLGKGGLDKLSARVGGSGANGSTNRDRTNYYQTVPADALEKMLWAEADKLGFFINTVSEEVLAKEKQVVKNEKRQSYDNQPYGFTQLVIDENLYPADHPYHWQVIGSLEDLQNATLADVKEFFNRWYVPNNVTLSVSGDFDPAQAKEWINKYFGEIKAGPAIPAVEKQPVMLTETKKLYHEDNFARLPELTLTWPGSYLYHPDAFALDILTQYLAVGKKAPLYKTLVAQKQLTADIDFYSDDAELTGQISLAVRAYENTPLDSVQAAVFETFAAFEQAGISAVDLARIQAGREVRFYNGISSVLGKGFQLAQYNIFTGDPDFINQYVANIKAVTAADVMRVYQQYIKDKAYVATSFVPVGQKDLALAGSAKAAIVEEAIVQGAEEQFDASLAATYEKTPSSFDRTVEPPSGKTPEISAPAIWKDNLANGLRVLGIYSDEVPMVQFTLRIAGGLFLDDPARVGVANLLAEMLTKGTTTKTAEELEEAIQKLGAVINVRASDEDLTISGSTLSRNYQATIDLLTEMILHPRWDEKELLLAQQSTISSIQQQQANPNNIATLAFRKLIYGKDHILANNILGTTASVAKISLADLQQYYAQKLSPARTSMQVVGAISEKEVVASLATLASEWKPVTVNWPTYAMAPALTQPALFIYDVPDAKQSVLRFGYRALAATDPDFYPAEVMNYILGGGSFASQLTQQLREGKGYTYGIYSDFSGSTIPGPFVIASGVRTNVTLEASELIRQIVSDYGKNYSEADLEVTKSALIKSNARAFETSNSKLSMLTDISTYGWPNDYLKQREKTVQGMTVDRIKALSGKYLNPNAMYYLVVGDAATQYNRLKALGLGDPVKISAGGGEALLK
ncbi:MAG: peptidase M16 [Bacteroidetes bacterium]|nr:MAG: peptidase M16 [Bacteroidota bacterium]